MASVEPSLVYNNQLPPTQVPTSTLPAPVFAPLNRWYLIENPLVSRDGAAWLDVGWKHLGNN